MSHEQDLLSAVVETIDDDQSDAPESAKEDTIEELRTKLYNQAKIASDHTFVYVDNVFPVTITRTEGEGNGRVELEEPLYPFDLQRFLEIWLAHKTDFLFPPQIKDRVPDLTKANVAKAYDLEDNGFLERKVEKYSDRGPTTETTVLGLIGDLNSYSTRLRAGQESRNKLKPKQRRTHI